MPSFAVMSTEILGFLFDKARSRFWRRCNFDKRDVHLMGRKVFGIRFFLNFGMKMTLAVIHLLGSVECIPMLDDF